MSEPRPDPHQAPQEFDREISVRGIMWFGVGLAVAVIVSGLISWWVFASLRRAERQHDLPPSPIVRREGTPAVPEPHLQTTPERDLAAMRAVERERLTRYAWLDRARGVARVPVERSMVLLLQQGLPTRPNAPDWSRPVWHDPTHAGGLAAEVQP